MPITKKTSENKEKKKEKTGTAGYTPKSNSATYTKKETDTPQFKARTRSADARAEENEQ